MEKRWIHAFPKDINAKWNAKKDEPKIWTRVAESISNDDNRSSIHIFSLKYHTSSPHTHQMTFQKIFF